MKNGLITLCIRTHCADPVAEIRGACAALSTLKVLEVHLEDRGMITLCVEFDPTQGTLRIEQELRAMTVVGVTITEIHAEDLGEEDDEDETFDD